MREAFCPKCNKKVEYTLKKNVIEKYKGVNVNIIENIAVCKNCGSNIFVSEIENDNLNRLYEKYRSLIGIITPDDILKFREKYNISQRELVSILGWGKMTINRYERGALPSQSHRDILKTIILNEEIFKEKVEEAYKLERISDKLYNKLNKDFNSTISNYGRRIINAKLKHSEDIYNGFRKFDIERVENLISYIADKVNNLYKTSLNKYLWFIDFEYFKENIRSITGLRYQKQQFGPVIEDKGYEDLINFLDSKFYKDEYENCDGSCMITKIKSNKNYDMSIFSDDEMEVINNVIENFKGMPCRDISEKSHLEDGWKESDIEELITYDYAEKLKITFNK